MRNFGFYFPFLQKLPFFSFIAHFKFHFPFLVIFSFFITIFLFWFLSLKFKDMCQKRKIKPEKANMTKKGK